MWFANKTLQLRLITKRSLFYMFVLNQVSSLIIHFIVFRFLEHIAMLVRFFVLF